MIPTLLAAIVVSAGGVQTKKLSWYPVYIVEAQTQALDIAAPDAVTATTFAQSWSINSGVPCAEYNYSGVKQPGWQVRDPMTNALVDVIPLYQPSTKPYVSMNARSTVGYVWWASASLPTQKSASFRTPTKEEWDAVVAKGKDAANEQYDDLKAQADPRFALGWPYGKSINMVNGDNPLWVPTWNYYRRYFINQRVYVWYYQASSKTEAQAKAQSEWIDGGVYAYGKALPWKEYMLYQQNPSGWSAANGNFQFPVRMWGALQELGCEPYDNERDPLPGSFEYISDAPYSKRPPYDNRSL